MVTSAADIQTVVIENGSSMCKGGFAGDDQPQCYFPERVARPKEYAYYSSPEKYNFIGEEVYSKRGSRIITYPVEYGRIRNWDFMPLIWRHIYETELHLDPQETQSLLPESPFNPTSTRIKIAEHFFEQLQIRAFYLANQAVLALLSVGKVTGTVVDAGHTVTQSMPVYEGYGIFNTAQESYIGGRDVTASLGNALLQHGFSYTAKDAEDVMNDIKHRCCYVALDSDIAMKQQVVQEGKDVHNKNYRTKDQPTTYTMPDGTELTLGAEQFTSAEVMFDPSVGGKRDCNSIQKLCVDSMQKCDLEVQKDLYRTILLVGGTARLKGFPKRFERELASAAPGIKTEISAPIEGKFSVWIGGSIWGSLSSFKTLRITKSEYQEHGFNVIQRRCY